MKELTLQQLKDISYQNEIILHWKFFYRHNERFKYVSYSVEELIEKVESGDRLKIEFTTEAEETRPLCNDKFIFYFLTLIDG